MRLRLKRDRLLALLAASPLSQNHWAIKLGLSRGHWSDIVNGKHPYPSVATRQRMIETFAVALDELFEAEDGQPGSADLDFRMAIAARYTILEEIGQGGMGTVYLATDLRHRRNVALKAVMPEAASGVGPAALLEEVALVSRLHHPNILPLFDSGEAAGHPWFVMPWVEGGSLRDVLNRRGRLPLPEAVTIIDGVAGALTHAHGRGLLHCDVKPENILLHGAHPFVMDFGIARKMHSEAEEWAGLRKELDFSAGTPAYVSPEQASGTLSLDGRSDLYSLGCVVFEMLSGRRPFEGDNTRRIVSRRFLEPPPDLGALAPDLPSGVVEAVRRAMARNPEDRQESPLAFATELRRAATGALASVASVTFARRVRRVVRRVTSGSLLHDVRYAVRGVRREPAFAVFIVATLALGIGANVAMFGVMDRLLLTRPAHIAQPERLGRFYMRMAPADPVPLGPNDRVSGLAAPPNDPTKWMGFSIFEGVKGASRVFEDIAAHRIRPALLGRGIDARQLQTGWVTANFFPLLGVTPDRGRFFTEEESHLPGADRVAVISHELWRSAFGGDSAIVGKPVTFDEQSYTIVGIAPPGFTGVSLERVEMWVPMTTVGMCRPGIIETGCTTVNWNLVGRLRAGVTFAAASEDATAAHRRAYTGSRRRVAEAEIIVGPLSHNDVARESGETRVARWLVGVSGVVLLITCANVVNLLLARTLRRKREVAVRLALGAGRARLVRLLLAEGLVLAIAGGVASLGVALLTGRFVQSVLLPNVVWSDPLVDPRTVVTTVLLVLGAGLIVGLVPAIQASRPDLTGALKAGAREGGGQRSRLRALLTVTQTALSVVLVVGAGLFVRSLWSLRAIDLGLEPERVVTAEMRVSPPAGSEGPFERSMASIRRAEPLYERAVEVVRRLPDVEYASLAVGLPFLSHFTVGLRVPGLDSIPRLEGGGPFVNAVARDYFQTVGTPILRGRGFTDADREGSAPVTIVSATMASTLWPGREALGECLFIGDRNVACSRIVGIAADAHRNGFREAPSMQYYVPLGQERGLGIAGTILVARARGNPGKLWAPLRRMMQEIDPAVVFVDLTTLESALDAEVRPWRLGATVFTMCGILALLVAAVGLYSVLSYFVAQRTHEIGVRVALGASGRTIGALILRTGTVFAAAGVAIGLGLALLAGRWLQPLLFETKATDILVFGIAAATLVIVALLAGLLPARRAMRVSPLTALQAD